MTNELVALLRKLVDRAHWVSEEEAKEAAKLVDTLETPPETPMNPTEKKE